MTGSGSPDSRDALSPLAATLPTLSASQFAQLGLKPRVLGAEPVAFGPQRLLFLAQPLMLGLVNRIRSVWIASSSSGHHVLDGSGLPASIVSRPGRVPRAS